MPPAKRSDGKGTREDKEEEAESSDNEEENMSDQDMNMVSQDRGLTVSEVPVAPNCSWQRAQSKFRGKDNLVTVLLVLCREGECIVTYTNQRTVELIVTIRT